MKPLSPKKSTCHQRNVKWTLNNGLNFFLSKFSLLNLRRWNYGNLLNSVLSLFEGWKILISSASVSWLLLEEIHFEKEPSSLSSSTHHGERKTILSERWSYERRPILTEAFARESSWYGYKRWSFVPLEMLRLYLEGWWSAWVNAHMLGCIKSLMVSLVQGFK